MIPAAADQPGVTVTAEALLALRRYLRPVAGGPWRPDARPAGFPGRRRGAGLEAVDVRPYTEGDDLRHLDRNVTARTGVPHVRSYREERGATVILVADLRRVMFWGTRRALRAVAACEALALCGWRAVEAGGRVGLYAFGGGAELYVPPRSRMPAIAAVAGGLALAQSRALAAGEGAEPDLGAALEAAARLAPTGATLVFASSFDDPGPDFPQLAEALARHGRLRAVLLRDAFETAPPPGAYPYVSPDGHRHVAQVSARTPAGDLRQTRLEGLGVPVLAIGTADGPETMARAWDRFDGPVR